jgi:hypothetical protein
MKAQQLDLIPVAAQTKEQLDLIPVAAQTKEERRGRHPFCLECSRRSVADGSYGPPEHGLGSKWFCATHAALRWNEWVVNNGGAARAAKEPSDFQGQRHLKPRAARGRKPKRAAAPITAGPTTDTGKE